MEARLKAAVSNVQALSGTKTTKAVAQPPAKKARRTRASRTEDGDTGGEAPYTAADCLTTSSTGGEVDR